MARVNAYIRAGNENREVSVGGRKVSNRVYAWLNTAHRLGESAIRVSAQVVGSTLVSKDRRLMSTIDDRKTVFTVTLPEPSDAVEVRIESSGAWASELIAMGAALGGVKALEQAAAGNIEGAKVTLDNFAEILQEHEKSLTNLPEVVLLGGVTLRQALAAVAVVNQLKQGGSIN